VHVLVHVSVSVTRSSGEAGCKDPDHGHEHVHVHGGPFRVRASGALRLRARRLRRPRAPLRVSGGCYCTRVAVARSRSNISSTLRTIAGSYVTMACSMFLSTLEKLKLYEPIEAMTPSMVRVFE
jgi:hypothetical protein